KLPKSANFPLSIWYLVKNCSKTLFQVENSCCSVSYLPRQVLACHCFFVACCLVIKLCCSRWAFSRAWVSVVKAWVNCWAFCWIFVSSVFNLLILALLRFKFAWCPSV